MITIELDKRYRDPKVAEAEALFIGAEWHPVETRPGEWHLQIDAGTRGKQVLRALRAAYPTLTFRVVDCDLPAAVQS